MPHLRFAISLSGEDFDQGTLNSRNTVFIDFFEAFLHQNQDDTNKLIGSHFNLNLIDNLLYSLSTSKTSHNLLMGDCFEGGNMKPNQITQMEKFNKELIKAFMITKGFVEIDDSKSPDELLYLYKESIKKPFRYGFFDLFGLLMKSIIKIIKILFGY